MTEHACKIDGCDYSGSPQGLRSHLHGRKDDEHVDAAAARRHHDWYPVAYGLDEEGSDDEGGDEGGETPTETPTEGPNLDPSQGGSDGEGGDTLDLGDKTLEFIDAPWLHWPETMFTYFQEEGILFPSDFFGAHIATPKLYADEFGDDVLKRAKDYFGEIMMPFRPRAKRALEELEEYKINTIAPSHGVIYRNPEKILEAHRSWTSSEVEEKVLIPYISMWGSTAEMVHVLTESVAAAGVDAVPFDVSSQSLDNLAGELVDSAGVVFGTPTVLAGPHPQIIYIATLAKKLNPPTKYFGVVESHGWAGGAVRELSGLVEGMTGELLGGVEVKGSPGEEDLDRVVELGEKLVENIGS